MTDWKPDERYRKNYGDFIMVPESPKGGGQSAHLITLPDGRKIRVLPDDRHSGRARSALVLGVMPMLEALGASSAISEAHVDPATYLSGYLTEAGLKWEKVVRDESFEDWLVDWWRDDNDLNPNVLAIAIEKAGWRMVRGDEK